MKHAVVVGAGIGGLSAASLLAAKGYRVSVYEKNDTPGGKMQELRLGGYRFDTGPSLLTMPFLLEQLFEECGSSLGEFLSCTPLSPVCRYFYPDGVVFDNYTRKEKTVREINRFAPEDAEAYTRFLRYSSRLYQRTSGAFLFNPLYGIRDVFDLNLLDFLKIDAFSTVSEKIDRYFSSPYMRQFFKRFTTYNGSSPYRAPATLNVIPHAELNIGGYYVEGGMYTIARALAQLATLKGAKIHYRKEVRSLRLSGNTVTGIELADGSRSSCDLLVSNAGAAETLNRLLPSGALKNRQRKRLAALEPSCSGFVLLLGCDKQWPQLAHHNVFFSQHYRQEFDDIFTRKKMPDDPTIYIANTSGTNPSHAPEGGSNLFILVNAPYLHESQNWAAITPVYRKRVIELLEQKGLDGLAASVEVEDCITPPDFYHRYSSNRGSIYGISSNTKTSAFLRPRNKVRNLKNVYLVGGSSHPGGGIPLVVQSARNAMELIGREM